MGCSASKEICGETKTFGSGICFGGIFIQAGVDGEKNSR